MCPMHLQGEVPATAAAEQLLAEEADAAAKAAAKRTKKQKAKARKQQALSEATSASEPSADLSLHTQQDQAPMATLHQSSPSASRGCGLSPDQDIVSLASQVQGMMGHDAAVLTPPALDEQLPTSATAADGGHAGSAAAVDTSQGDDARFLDQLFCCPITQVLSFDPQAPATVSGGLLCAQQGCTCYKVVIVRPVGPMI